MDDADVVKLNAEEIDALEAQLIEAVAAMPDELEVLSKRLGLRAVTTGELALVLGLTDRRVEQLAADGWLPSRPRQDRRGLSFDLLRAVQAYVDFLRG